MSAAIAVETALAVVESFVPEGDDLAAKSRQLTLDLLRWSEAPFSRKQFAPGHITCTALVRHPQRDAVLVMHHHRLMRWLLPGGHVEKTDQTLAETAAREAREETSVQIDPAHTARLAGIDVHGIPGKRSEPMHLHHDIIWCFRALTGEIAVSEEAPRVQWATQADWDSLDLAENIRRSIFRAGAGETR